MWLKIRTLNSASNTPATRAEQRRPQVGLFLIEASETPDQGSWLLLINTPF